MEFHQLTDEQQRFIQIALQGHHILVDACIGSGKTTAIQCLCNLFDSHKRILYLTYNRLLKVDAREKIRMPNVTVTNYHGFAYQELRRIGVSCGVSDLMQVYNQKKPKPYAYDVLILDEYQDVEQESANLLQHLADSLPQMQRIAVGDLSQKIYDKTRLDAGLFIQEFLTKRHYELEFTRCFRLSADYAGFLGNLWQKRIVGVNPDCRIRQVSLREALRFLGEKCQPEQVLVLGSQGGFRNELLNCLEKQYAEKYNKQTVWAQIGEYGAGKTQPDASCAVFTTYDGSKGMEREVCVLCDWSESYWNTRISRPQAKYEIIRNIFLVAASRGKREILFVDPVSSPYLEPDTIISGEGEYTDFDDVDMANMFDFKYVEDVEDCYRLLDVRETQPKGAVIPARLSDGLIDLSPCIGILQEALYFTDASIDLQIEHFFAVNEGLGGLRKDYRKWGIEAKVLYLSALETRQFRYLYQVKGRLLTVEAVQQIRQRFRTWLGPGSRGQVSCCLSFLRGGEKQFDALGLVDAVRNNVAYEFKFVSQLTHVHALQCACYVAALGLEFGRLWNIRDNQMLEIRIPDRKAFLDQVARTVTKGLLKRYEVPAEWRHLFYLQTDVKELPAKPASVSEEPPVVRQDSLRRFIVYSGASHRTVFADTYRNALLRLFPDEDFIRVKAGSAQADVKVSCRDRRGRDRNQYYCYA